MPNLCANNLHFFLTKPFLGVISAHIEKKKQLFFKLFFDYANRLRTYFIPLRRDWKSHREIRRRLGIERVLCTRL